MGPGPIVVESARATAHMPLTKAFRPPTELVAQSWGPAALTSQQSNLWRERVAQECWATSRAHPRSGQRTALSRQARLATEIDLALLFAAKVRAGPTEYTRARTEVAEARRVRREQRAAALAIRAARPTFVLGQHVATPVSEAGSLTTMQLQELGCRFKNETSGTWS